MAGAPRVGELMYADPDKRIPVVVTHVDGTWVNYIPADIAVQGTHKGNLYDGDGNHPYWDR